MSSTTHTEESKPGRYRTLVLIIGVLVALVIGLSISASAFTEPMAIPTEVSGSNSITSIISALKMGSAAMKGLL